MLSFDAFAITLLDSCLLAAAPAPMPRHADERLSFHFSYAAIVSNFSRYRSLFFFFAIAMPPILLLLPRFAAGTCFADYLIYRYSPLTTPFSIPADAALFCLRWFYDRCLIAALLRYCHTCLRGYARTRGVACQAAVQRQVADA